MKYIPIVKQYSGNNRIVMYATYYHIYGLELVKRAVSLLKSANKPYITCTNNGHTYIQVLKSNFPVPL